MKWPFLFSLLGCCVFHLSAQEISDRSDPVYKRFPAYEALNNKQQLAEPDSLCDPGFLYAYNDLLKAVTGCQEVDCSDLIIDSVNTIYYSSCCNDLIVIHAGGTYDFYWRENQHAVTVSHNVITFNNPGKVMYKFGLITPAADTFWNRSHLAVLRFSGLLPGIYHLLVYSTESRQLRNEVPLHLVFHIRPRFWQTVWFRIMIVCLLLGLMVFILQQQERKFKKKIEEKSLIEIEINKLKLEALKSKVNPHFTFNVLNSIQEMVLKDDRLNASDHIASFGRMNRMLLENSSKTLIPIREELALIEEYLKLEKLRLKDQLDYQVKIDPRLDDQVEIAPNITLSFVENAVVHGIAPLGKKGTIKVYATLTDRQVKITIEDNGIGRTRAMENRKRSNSHNISMGMQLSMRQMEILNQKKQRGHVAILDLYDQEKRAAGTRVEITYPTG